MKTWVSSDACTPWLLLLRPAQPSPCSSPGPDICGPCCQGDWRGEERRTREAPLPTNRGGQSQRGVSQWGEACGSNFLAGLGGAQKLRICVGWSSQEGFLERRGRENQEAFEKETG